jgi:hypothetical protein
MVQVTHSAWRFLHAADRGLTTAAKRPLVYARTVGRRGWGRGKAGRAREKGVEDPRDLIVAISQPLSDFSVKDSCLESRLG